MPPNRRAASLYALFLCLCLAAPAAAQHNVWLLSAGGGTTNR